APDRPVQLIVTQKGARRGHFVLPRTKMAALGGHFRAQGALLPGRRSGSAADRLVRRDFLALARVLDAQRAQGGGADDDPARGRRAGATGRAHGAGTCGGSREATDGVDARGGVVDHGAVGEADGGAAVLGQHDLLADLDAFTGAGSGELTAVAGHHGAAVDGDGADGLLREGGHSQDGGGGEYNLGERRHASHPESLGGTSVTGLTNLMAKNTPTVGGLQGCKG